MLCYAFPNNQEKSCKISLCIESKNKENIIKFIEDFISIDFLNKLEDKIKRDNKGEKVENGYPQFLITQ